MRITNGVLVNGFLTDMNTNLNNLYKIQNQLNTGKVFTKPSDDPFRVARSMQMYSEINANKQYNTNIKDTINWMDTTDTAMTQGIDCLQRIRELMVSAGDAAYGSTEFDSIKNEINEKVAEFGQIMNTSFDGKYIFGGKDAVNKPVTVQECCKMTPDNDKVVIGDTKDYTGSYPGKIQISVDKTNSKVNVNGTDMPMVDGKVNIQGVDFDFSSADVADGANITVDVGNKLYAMNINGDEALVGGKLVVEISSGVTAEYSVSACDVLKFKDKNGNDTNAMDIFGDILKDLESATGQKKVIGDDLTNIDKILDNMLKVSSKVGTIQNRMESAKDINTAQNQNLTEILSYNEDIDLVAKTMEYATAQTIYLASLQTSAKVLQPTLMDYL